MSPQSQYLVTPACKVMESPTESKGGTADKMVTVDVRVEPVEFDVAAARQDAPPAEGDSFPAKTKRMLQANIFPGTATDAMNCTGRLNSTCTAVASAVNTAAAINRPVSSVLLG